MQTKAEIELLVAQRFPQADVPTLVRAVAPVVVAGELAPGPIALAATQPARTQVEPELAAGSTGATDLTLAPGPIVSVAAQPAPSAESRVPAHARLTPLAPSRYAIQVTVDQETHDHLRYAQALLGHAVPSGDVASVLKRALDALVNQLERQKFAKGARSRAQRKAGKGRHVPAEVRCAVWQRDEGRCTFVSDKGKRCEATSRLEFDHIEPLAKGGRSTAKNLRLRCRAHNQYAADCAFGAGFMHAKRRRAPWSGVTEARGACSPA